MSEEIKTRPEGDPKYPFVKFMKIKKYGTESREVPSHVYVKVSGVHGTPDAMLEFEKQGMVIIGYGNLDAQKYNSLKSYCDSRTGARMHPSMKAALETQGVMNAKIERARSTKTA